MKHWHKEPLLHFLVIGAVIFTVFPIANKEEAAVSDKEIVVTTADIQRLTNNWAKRWNRQPTETELNGLIESYIKEEVYYREALALGLDKNDTILRRRLMQKMEFLSNDLAEMNQPDESTLNTYFLENQDKYRHPARISFTHIYFSAEKRGAKALADAKKAMSGLNLPRGPERGDRFMLAYDFVRETPSAVARLFGKNFADKLFSLKSNTWEGPIASGYGLHLVRISEKIDSRMPELASVIDKVRTDWMFEQRKKMNNEIYERFKENYEIIVEDMPNKSEMAKTTLVGRKTS